ncbi:hypothetical protein [Cellulomonas sp. P24]|uniref:hypothetical protein n=1 Tax=Cellulomonas sp. P24 TaxID=2885206 RepID=UPI00216B1F25|nr:hypothetical protein [Cellulomonas sp. P24]MCR6494760.1 hypothetical protein [Cellulomonas sp. P24]
MPTDTELIDAAVVAFTAIARSRRTVGAGTAHEHAEPVDFAEIACQVLTSAAANVGGVETLLSGRPNSWEADYVRQIVLSTAGDSIEDLLRWRTEPLRLVLDTESELADLGLEQQYEDAADAAARRENHAHETMIMDSATPEEKTRIAEIRSRTVELLGEGGAGELERERAAQLAVEAWVIVTAVTERAQISGGPVVDAHAKALAACDAVDDLWEHDKAAYRAAYADGIRESLSARGVTIAVEFVDPPIDTSGSGTHCSTSCTRVPDAARRSGFSRPCRATPRPAPRVPVPRRPRPSRAACMQSERTPSRTPSDPAPKGWGSAIEQQTLQWTRPDGPFVRSRVRQCRNGWGS